MVYMQSLVECLLLEIEVIKSLDREQCAEGRCMTEPALENQSTATTLDTGERKLVMKSTYVSIDNEEWAEAGVCQ